MASGHPPFLRDALDVLIDRRLKRRYLDDMRPGGRGPVNIPPETFLRQDVLSPAEQPGPEALADPVKRPPFLRRVLNRVGSDEGLSAISAALAPQEDEGGFLGGFTTSLGRGLGATAASRRQRRADEAAASKLATEQGFDERRIRADEERARAATTTAGRERTGSQTRYEQLSDEAKFLGEQGVNTSDYYKRTGIGGRGSTGRQTDLDKVAGGLVATGRAPDLETAYVMARTVGQQPQQVGSIARTVSDPKNIFNTTSTRVTVWRRINQATGDFELIDAQGNLVTPEDYKTFQGDMTFGGGTGGPANTPPPELENEDQGGGAVDIRQQIEQAYNSVPRGVAGAPGAPSTTAAPPPAAPAPATPGSDFVPAVQGVSEEQIIQALMAPGVDPNLASLYAAGRGPMGNSTRIKAAAGMALGARR